MAKKHLTHEEHAAQYIQIMAQNPAYDFDRYCSQYRILAAGQRDLILEAVKRILEGKQPEERKNAAEHEIKRFIFDEDKVNKKKIFPALKIENKYCFGLLLPREKDVYDKDGQFVNTVQVDAPALITSDHELLPVGEELLTKYKIRIDTLPAEYPLRWALPSIYEYVQNGKTATGGKDIFDKICNMYKKYLYFHHPEWYEVHALWDVGTYFFMLFYYYPIFELRGTKGTAKNKIMAISRGFTFNATEEMTNPSEASLFHDTAEKRPTKYLDEAEKLFSIKNGKAEPDNRAELINASYKYTGTVPRMDKIGNRYVKLSYPVYSPTMLASINGLFGATEDRALVHITTKAPKGDERANLEPNPNDQIFEEVRNELYIFALENAALVEKTYNEIEANGLTARELFLWKPLFTLAKLIDSEVYKRLVDFAQTEAKIKALDSVAEDSIEWRILAIAYAQFEHNEGILAKQVREDWIKQYGEQYAPHSKTITGHLDRFGLRQYKDHFAEGNGYRLTKEVFVQVIQSTVPSLFASLPSFPSVQRDKDKEEEMKKNEGNEGKKEKKEERQQSDVVNAEANEGNEDYEDGLTGACENEEPSQNTLTQEGGAGNEE